tara:strand:+ start:20 stop:421 length:402 start_codon:yes stop_codon:yes gene_type:complete
MTLIYKIQDNTNGNIYIGSTKQPIHRRMINHKKEDNTCSSKEIIKNNNYDVIVVEECNETNRNEREQFYIDTLDCVNIKNVIYDEKKYKKEYYIKNKEHKKEYDKVRREWTMSFGESKRDVCNIFYTKDNLFC